jgi:hypothetical protein
LKRYRPESGVTLCDSLATFSRFVVGGVRWREGASNLASKFSDSARDVASCPLLRFDQGANAGRSFVGGRPSYASRRQQPSCRRPTTKVR